MESRGVSFLQEIRDAIEAADRMIAVIGPHAVKSDYVRYEWEHALFFCRGVLPILRIGEFSFIPAELGKLDCIDFRDDHRYDETLKNLLRKLATPIPDLGPLRATPALPPHFLPRRDYVLRAQQTILEDVQRPVLITSAKQTSALQGMGGIGKSVLAATLARTVETRRAFKDGIIWLTAGQDGNLLRNLTLVGEIFGDDLQHYQDIEIAKSHVSQVLENKVCLIILDDVWDVSDASPFRDALGPRCRLLITTRDASLIGAIGAVVMQLEVLSDEEALRLLANWCGEEPAALPEEAGLVAKECGNLPFALSLCGAMWRDGISWQEILDALRDADLEFIEKKFPNYPYTDVFKAMQVSVDALDREDSAGTRHYREHYQELAVFPADTDVPEAAVLTLWSHTNGLKAREARKLLTLLESKALLRLKGETPRRFFTMHDLQFDYIKATAGDLSVLHKRLVQSYRALCQSDWHKGPNDGYYIQYLPGHMAQAGQTDELEKLLFDYRWLRVKLETTGPEYVIGDFSLLQDDDQAKTLGSTFRRLAHIVATAPEQLPSQLWARLEANDGPHIKRLLDDARSNLGHPALLPIRRTLPPPTSSLIRILLGHEGPVKTLAITPDGRYVVSGSGNYFATDWALRVWDIETGRLTHTLEGHTNGVESVAVTPDGRRVVSGSDDETVRVWDLDTGQEINCLRGQGEHVLAVSVTADGRRIISGGVHGGLKVWRLESGSLEAQLGNDDDWILGVATTPDGRHVVSCNFDHTLKVWDLASGELKAVFEANYNPNVISLTADGKRLLCGMRDDTEIKVWDVETGDRLPSLVSTGRGIEALAVSPDGKYVVSGSSDHTIKVWDVESGDVRANLLGHGSQVLAVAITPDGKHLVSGSFDRTIRIWDLSSKAPATEWFGHESGVQAVSITPDGKRAVSASGPWFSQDHTLKIWDIDTATPVLTLAGHTDGIEALAITPDGQCAVSGSRDGTLKVWDLDNGRLIASFEKHTRTGGSVNALAVSSDGKRVISGSGDAIVSTRNLIVWDLPNGRMAVDLKGHSAGVKAVAITPDGKRAVSASYDGTCAVWDLDKGACLVTYRARNFAAESIAITPDGERVLCGSRRGALEIFELATGRHTAVLQGPGLAVLAVIIDPSGKRAVSFSGDSGNDGIRDSYLNVWDLEANERVRSLGVEGRGIVATALTPDGNRIISASADDTLRLWDLETGDLLASFRGDARFTCCTLTPNGRCVIAGDAVGHVHFLDMIPQ